MSEMYYTNAELTCMDGGGKERSLGSKRITQKGNNHLSVTKVLMLWKTIEDVGGKGL